MRFSRLAESNIIGVIVTNMNNGSIIEANDAFLKILGYTREDLSANQMNLRDITPPEYIFLSECSLEELKTTGVCKPFEKEYICKNGDRIPVLIGSVIVEDTQETVIGFVVDLSQQKAALRDVYDELRLRKQAEAALQQANERLRSFVKANVVGILFGDVNGSITEANDEFLRIVGYTQEDIYTGRLRWADITPSEYSYLDELAIAEATAKGTCTPYEKECIRKDGSRVPVVVGYSLLGESRQKSVAFILDIRRSCN
jgi:PAS domain S-box-containing protein